MRFLSNQSMADLRRCFVETRSTGSSTASTSQRGIRSAGIWKLAYEVSDLLAMTLLVCELVCLAAELTSLMSLSSGNEKKFIRSGERNKSLVVLLLLLLDVECGMWNEMGQRASESKPLNRI